MISTCNLKLLKRRMSKPEFAPNLTPNSEFVPIHPISRTTCSQQSKPLPTPRRLIVISCSLDTGTRRCSKHRENPRSSIMVTLTRSQRTNRWTFHALALQAIASTVDPPSIIYANALIRSTNNALLPTEPSSMLKRIVSDVQTNGDFRNPPRTTNVS